MPLTGQGSKTRRKEIRQSEYGSKCVTYCMLAVNCQFIVALRLYLTKNVYVEIKKNVDYALNHAVCTVNMQGLNWIP